MMKKVFISSIAVFMLSLYTGYCQKVWTLEECIGYAHQNNLQIKRQELTARISNNNFNQSKFNILPNLNAGVSRNMNFGRSVDPFTNEFITENTNADNYYAQSGLNLFNGLQTYNTIQSYKYQFLKNSEDVIKAKNDITLQIALAYLQILFNKELVEIALSQYEVTLLQIEKTKKLVDVGNIAVGELYKMEAQAASENLNVTNARNNLKLAFLDLTQLLDLDSAEGFDIVTPVGLEINLNDKLEDVNTIYQAAVKFLPQIKSAEYQLKGYEKYLAIQQGRRSPQISMRGTYYTGYSDARSKLDVNSVYDQTIGYLRGDLNQPVTAPSYGITEYPYNEQIKDNAYKSLSLSISIPVFNNRQVETGISNAKISVMDSKLELDQAKQVLYKEIQQAHADAVAALEKFKSGVEAVKSNEEAFNYTQQKFDVGLINYVDYNISKNELLKANSELLQAKYEYIFKIKILDFYMGKSIVL
ncbi:MAG: TolC family protein [Bacteroidales bacterium]|nr:TolC family protein [Bacteroidales bacterium]